MSKSAIVIGAGIVGLATARALASRNYKVTVLERTERAVGASIRNFGMIWPIGQPDGLLYERAMLSRSIWKQVCEEAGIWHEEAGSLHLANNELEDQVLQEFYHEVKDHRQCTLLDKARTAALSEAVVTKNLRSALYSKDEMIVDPRAAIATLPAYLKEKYDVNFVWQSGVTKIFYPNVWCGKKTFEADEIYLCNGADFETLYPEQYANMPLTKCKLQMMRLEAQPGNWRMGPSLCGGLSLTHYKSFEAAASLKKLKAMYQESMPEYLKWGIHVMASQNQHGEITVGDSHEYGQVFDPFDKVFINDMIIDYLHTFAHFPLPRVMETWNGIYAKLTNGGTEIIHTPQKGVTIINGLSGAGMTLSFGLCEQVIAGTYKPSLSAQVTVN